MYQSIETKAYELKEIALQIMNIIADKKNGALPYAYTYLEQLTNGKMEEAVKHYHTSAAKAYEIQLLYCLSNLAQWRGNEAKAYKGLLKQYLAYFQGKQNTGKLNESVTPLWGMIANTGD